MIVQKCIRTSDAGLPVHKMPSLELSDTDTVSELPELPGSRSRDEVLAMFRNVSMRESRVSLAAIGKYTFRNAQHTTLYPGDADWLFPSKFSALTVNSPKIRGSCMQSAILLPNKLLSCDGF